jgi:transposase InsO family protein
MSASITLARRLVGVFGAYGNVVRSRGYFPLWLGQLLSSFGDTLVMAEKLVREGVAAERRVCPCSSLASKRLHSGLESVVLCWRRRSCVNLPRPVQRLRAIGCKAAQAIRHRLAAATRPTGAALVAGVLADATRSRSALIAENALLRQQLITLRRSVKRPRCTPADQALLVLLAGRLRAWRDALLIVQPDTLLRWHRQLFRRHWRRRSRAAARAYRPPLAPETAALIRAMATANRTWGAERIRGELLKLDIRIAKSAIQKYTRAARPPRCGGQRWATFLRNHAGAIWACDFLPVTDALFRPVYAFFVIALGTRRVVHVGVSRHPTDAWVAQQLREATPHGERPRYLIRDNDRKYGAAFARVAAATGIREVRTAYRAPRQNATCERFLGSVRRECLDHILILGEGHLRCVLREYVEYFNHDRPHQGLAQRVPGASEGAATWAARESSVRATPILGGLYHAYTRAA